MASLPQQRPWYRNPLVWMVVVAFVLRLGVILWKQSYRFSSENQHYSFGLETGSMARSLAAGEGFASPFKGSTGPSAWLAPLYPALVALAFKLFGIFSPGAGLAVLALNSLFSALTCVAIFEVGRRTVGERAAWWSGWIWALTPHLMKWATEWVWEISLSALLAGLAYWLTLLLEEESTLRRWLLYGLLWGVVALTNPVLLSFAPFSFAYILWHRRRAWSAMVKPAMLAALVSLVLVTPWLVRNRLVLGKWTFIRDNFGYELHLGNYHLNFGYGWGGPHPSVSHQEWLRYKSMGEVAYVEDAQRQFVEFYRQYPDEFWQLTGKRFLAFWDGSSVLYMQNWKPLAPWQYAVTSWLALMGLVLALGRRLRGAALFLWLIVYPLPYYITYPQPRYRHAVEPQILLLATMFVGSALVWARDWLRERSHGARQTKPDLED